MIIALCGQKLNARFGRWCIRENDHEGWCAGPMFNWLVGDTVQKSRGYSWPGVVVAKFETTDGKPRVVVECTAQEVAGALHIYSPEQLEARDEG